VDLSVTGCPKTAGLGAIERNVAEARRTSCVSLEELPSELMFPLGKTVAVFVMVPLNLLETNTSSSIGG
jgi:hypothetical protein